jgi:hypothetical protein
MEADIKSLVESAYNEAEASGGESPESVSSVVAVGSADVAEASPGVAETSSDDGGSGESPTTKADRARDEKGKFAPKPKEGQALKPAASKSPAVAEGAVGGPPTTDGSQLSPPVVAEALKAPQSLTPAEREAFAKAPPEIQKALARIDQTVRLANQEAAPAKRFHQEAQAAFAPYSEMLQRSGFKSPVEAAQNAFHTIQQLQSGGPEQVVAVISSLIQGYGTKRFGAQFIEQLAAGIDGQPQQPGQQPAHIDPRQIAAQVRQEVMNDFQAQQEQRQKAQISKDLESFAADPQNEFFGDVGEVMLGLITATPKGRPIDIAGIYDRACYADPEIRAILQTRAKQVAAKATTASTQQARLAASSVKSTPSTGASSVRKPTTVREMVEAAYDAADGR